MKKKIAWIACCVLLLSNTVGRMAYATAPQGEEKDTVVQTESGEQIKGEAEQPDQKVDDTVEHNKDENVEEKQIVTSFADFDMEGFESYQSLTVPKGTALNDLGLPETLKAVIDGTEGDTEIPVTWKCIDDGFGGDTYTPSPENESAVYTFIMELPEGYELDSVLWKTIEEKNGTLPWIEVKYEVQESKSTKAGKLEDIALPATESNDKLVYYTDVTNSFDIQGKDGTATTFKNLGYEVLLGKNAVPAKYANTPSAALVKGKNGTVITKDEFQIQPILGFTADGAYVKVIYRIHNASDSAREVNMAIYGDIKIGSGDNADKAAIDATNTGIKMSDAGKQFNLYCKNTYGAVPADKLWFGAYDKRGEPGYIWSNAGDFPAGPGQYVDQDGGTWTSDSGKKLAGYTGGDSAMALSWQNKALAAGATQDFSFLMSVGATAEPPEINMETELTLGFDAEEVKVEADVKDVSGSNYQVSYSLDDGEEQILDASIGSTHYGDGPFTIPADNTKQNVKGTIAVPRDWAENSVHKLQVWVKNDKFAMSDVKTVYIIKRAGAGGGEVEPATEYTINFGKGADGASGTAPASIKAYEMTNVTLPLNTFTNTTIEFGGWSDGTNTYGAGDTYTMPSGNITLTATWLTYPITIKPTNATKYVGEALPSMSLEEVISEGGTSALQPGDTLASLGTAKYNWGTVDKDSPAKDYPIKLTIANQTKPKYLITCTDGTLTVLQDAPQAGTNYNITGTLGNNGWYNSTITLNPGGGGMTSW